ncbi:hypothetical protein QE152_g25779 [Popillia japonica]|uniref:Uncharacterized protein n=1 Tax=Popillia japonica TaxID=7064 RepID=A0AAW1JZD7_POPJA
MMKRFLLLVLLAVAATVDGSHRKLKTYMKFDNSYGHDCDEYACGNAPLEPNYCLEYVTTDVVEVHGICMAQKAICWSNKPVPARVVPMEVCAAAVPADKWQMIFKTHQHKH